MRACLLTARDSAGATPPFAIHTMKNLAILGSTGSVGTSALEVVSHLSDRIRVVALTTNTRWGLLCEQIEQFHPQAVAVADADACDHVRRFVQGRDVEVYEGPAGIESVARLPGVDMVLGAIVGAAALPSAMQAVEAGADLAIANKEVLVMAGPLILGLAREHGAALIPVDSEHSAVFQAMRAGRREEVRRVILTASGGPFHHRSDLDLSKVMVDEALNHPTWTMGPKVTIDSATLMNKALEIVEAKWLFGLRPDQIDVVIHPESIVHSLVEFCDGSVLAQLSRPDMRLPIQYALTYPERCPGTWPRLDLVECARLQFVAPDRCRFKALDLGYRVAEMGGTSGAVLNAANEEAVRLFVDRQITFDQITQLCETILSRHVPQPEPSLEQVFQADAWARQEIHRCLMPSSTP